MTFRVQPSLRFIINIIDDSVYVTLEVNKGHVAHLFALTVSTEVLECISGVAFKGYNILLICIILSIMFIEML